MKWHPSFLAFVRFDHQLMEGVENFQGNAVFNYTDAEVPYTRVIEHKHFEFGHQPDTVVSYEYSEQWKEGSEPYYPINNERNNELLRQGAKVTVVDRVAPDAAACAMADSLSFRQENLLNDDVSFLEEYKDIDMLMITAGFGRVAKFETIVPAEIGNSFQVNTVSLFKIIRFYYDRMLGDDDFYCGVMGSIAGLVSSPLFALYGATNTSRHGGQRLHGALRTLSFLQKGASETEKTERS